MNKQNSLIPALGGHVKDLWRLATFQTSHPHSWSKYRQLNAVRKRTGATSLVETGTYLGNTTMRCSHVFERVFTIELDQDLYAKASSYLLSRRNVVCIQGDATRELPKVLERDDCIRAVVFLDGHFSSGVTALGETPEPACGLLESLAQFRNKVCGIVVDDFRLFGVEKDWPKKYELIESAERLFPDFRLSIHMDQVLIENSVKPSSRL